MLARRLFNAAAAVVFLPLAAFELEVLLLLLVAGFLPFVGCPREPAADTPLPALLFAPAANEANNRLALF